MVDPDHGVETEACGSSGRNISWKGVSVSLQNHLACSLDSAVVHGGDPASPSASPPRAAGVGSVAAVSLLFVQTVPGFSTQPLPGFHIREL